MSDLNVGDRILDNDPRMARRTLTIRRMDVRYVYAENCMGREFRLLRNRVFADLKPRRTGFSVVRESSE